MRIRGRGVLGAGLLLVLVASQAVAAGEVGQRIARLSSSAPLVLVGEPRGQVSRWEDGGIWTYTEVAVRDRYGEETESTVIVRQRGGVVGRIGQKVTHVRLVDPRRPHLLFLWRDSESGSWIPGVGGVLPIELDSSGLEIVEGTLLSDLLDIVVGRR